MVSPEEQALRSDSVADAAARGDALDALLDASQWDLTETKWVAIEQILDAMQAALASGDRDAFVATTTDLELAGPFRITKIGSESVKPPRVVRDRLNQLVHALGGPVPVYRDRADAEETIRHDSTRRLSTPAKPSSAEARAAPAPAPSLALPASRPPPRVDCRGPSPHLPEDFVRRYQLDRTFRV